MFVPYVGFCEKQQNSEKTYFTFIFLLQFTLPCHVRYAYSMKSHVGNNSRWKKLPLKKVNILSGSLQTRFDAIVGYLPLDFNPGVTIHVSEHRLAPTTYTVMAWKTTPLGVPNMVTTARQPATINPSPIKRREQGRKTRFHATL